MSGYERLGAGANASRRVRDLTEAWKRVTPLGDASEEVRARVEAFCESRRITLAGLEALDTRVDVRGQGPAVVLAWATFGRVGERRVPTAVKYRPLDPSAEGTPNRGASTWSR